MQEVNQEEIKLIIGILYKSLEKNYPNIKMCI